MKNHVRFDSGFFKKTTREYKDYLQAFFREISQNGVDGKSTLINFYIEEKDDYFEVIYEDNGKGMTEEILSEKFLVMGGSHKEGDDNIGGFGYAKSLILFCHKEYSVHTNTSYVEGAYGQYSDIKSVDQFNGTRICIKMEKEGISKRILERKLRDWLINCHIKHVKFFLNNELLEQHPNRFEFKKEMNIGLLKFNDSINSYSSTIWVRMRGMAMFKREIYSNESVHFEGYIDLNAKSSLDCFTANRDGLNEQHEQDLNQLVRILSSERSMFSSENLNEFVMNVSHDICEGTSGDSNYSGQVMSDAAALSPIQALLNKGTVEDPLSEKSSIDFDFNEIKEREQTSKNNSNVVVDNSYDNVNVNESHQRVPSVIKENNEDNNVFSKIHKKEYTFAEKVVKTLNRINKSEYPSNFMIKVDEMSKNDKETLKTYNNVKNQLNLKKNIKLSFKWNNAINSILSILAQSDSGVFWGLRPDYTNNSFNYNYCSINTGFVVSENSDCYGLYTMKNEDIHILFNIEQSKKENLTDKDIIFIAIHEISHIFEPYHNETHAAIMFKVNKAINDSKIKIL